MQHNIDNLLIETVELLQQVKIELEEGPGIWWQTLFNNSLKH